MNRWQRWKLAFCIRQETKWKAYVDRRTGRSDYPGPKYTSMTKVQWDER